MSKIPLIPLNKQTDIGTSLTSINNNFSVLQKNIENQQEDQQDVQDFVDSIPQIFSDLKYSFDFFKKNYNTYKETMEVLINNKEKYLKPIITLYPQKFRYDNNKVNAKYIQNVLSDWVTSNYKISNSKLTQKPYYVEGQSIIIYFFRSSEIQEKSNILKTRDNIMCEVTTSIASGNCLQYTAAPTVCAPRKCGCVNCGGPISFKINKDITSTCYYNDNNYPSKQTERYLTSNISYNYTSYIENYIEFVKFVVEDCTWKVDNSPSSSITPYKNLYIDSPLQVLANKEQYVASINPSVKNENLEEFYTFN